MPSSRPGGHARRGCSRRGGGASRRRRGAAAAPLGNGIVALAARTGEPAALDRGRDRPEQRRGREVPSGSVHTQRTDRSRASIRGDRAVAHVSTPGVPTDLAAGAGAVWLGTGGGRSAETGRSASRASIRARRDHDRTVQLPGQARRRVRPAYNWGFRRHRGRCGRRLGDPPRPRRRPHRSPTPAGAWRRSTLVADGSRPAGEGVWFISPEDTTSRRSTPRTNRAGRRSVSDPACRARSPSAAADLGHGRPRGRCVAHRAGAEPGHEHDRRRFRGHYWPTARAPCGRELLHGTDADRPGAATRSPRRRRSPRCSRSRPAPAPAWVSTAGGNPAGDPAGIGVRRARGRWRAHRTS